MEQIVRHGKTNGVKRIVKYCVKRVVKYGVKIRAICYSSLTPPRWLTFFFTFLFTVFFT
jgi:hypothetical protein